MSAAPLPEIPVWDYRDRGLGAYALDRIAAAERVMDTVLAGMGPVGRGARAALPLGDRIAERWLRRARDPYLSEIRAVRDAMGRPGALAFALSFEFGCTARVFAGAPPRLFRTLDWPFKGLGRLVEIVRLSGPAGPWITATWPGVMGVLQGAAPGRFAAALNQGPERRSGLGRPVDWGWGKVRFARTSSLPPPHLLRRVLETAPDFESARRALRDAPITAPAIFTLAGLRTDEALAIERTETGWAEAVHPAAANAFTGIGPSRRWRARGIDSAGRLRQIAEAAAPPEIEAPPAPILNDLTRLAVALDADGHLAVRGFEGLRPVTAPGRAAG